MKNITRNLFPRFSFYIALLAALGLLWNISSYAARAADPHSVPSVDGGTGPCSVEFTVHDESGAPIYAAKVRVHFSYGFVGAHKMDLEVATNVDGKARFSGLPKKAKIALYFEATQGNKEADFNYDPAASCKAEQTLVLKNP